MTLLRLHLSLVVVASSYLTLGLFSPGRAEELWAWYGGLSLLLAALSLWKEMGRRA